MGKTEMNVDTVFEHVLHENVLSRGGVKFFVADVFGVSIVENHPLLSYFFCHGKMAKKGCVTHFCVCYTFAVLPVCEYASMRPFFLIFS